jgi:mRNA interferase ChpB
MSMMRRKIAHPGEVYWIDPHPVARREMKDKHRFIIITPPEINTLGVAMTVPVTSGGQFARHNGLTVVVMGHDTNGVAVCHHVRSFDLQTREEAGTARYIETLDAPTINGIISRVLSIIDPGIG